MLNKAITKQRPSIQKIYTKLFVESGTKEMPSSLGLQRRERWFSGRGWVCKSGIQEDLELCEDSGRLRWKEESQQRKASRCLKRHE